ncbi:MAG TPA: xylulokinase [Ktedonobacterales bacterium]|nr:xylulokinase [Ktedonobacterales bacterium]
MPRRTLLLGIDLSTTGAKALLIDEQGRTVASASTPLMLSTPRPLWAEQHPHDWWDATAASIRTALATAEATGDEVRAIGLTGQMHGLALLDGQGEPLRPAILWNDQRTAVECDEIRARMGKSRLIAVTGNDALPGFTAPKVLWVRRHEPEIYARAAHILLPKDYIRYRLTGDFAMDKADGSGTLLFDLAARGWSSEVTASLDIPSSWLPPTHEGPSATGVVSAEAAALTGLAVGTPVMAGGGDQSAQAVGVGAIDPGMAAVTLGTSGVVFAATSTPLFEPEGRLHAFCHAVPGRWHLMGVMLAAAGSLQWLRDTLAPDVTFDALMDEAAQAPAGSEGLLFLPYLSGERTPHPDPLARGAWVGLTLRHTRAHMIRAVLEGVSFGLRDGFILLSRVGLRETPNVRISGGGARSPLWRAILASVLATPLESVAASEGAAYGAALLAGVGVGIWPDVTSACAATITPGEITAPNAEWQAEYERLYPVYQSLYPALKPTFAALADVD